MALILDTGPLLAAMDASDPDHGECARLVAGSSEELVLPSPILPELDYWLHKAAEAGALLALVKEIRAGVFRVEDPTPADYARIGELLETYVDMRVGFVDAAVMAIVERLGEPKLATLDRRHFTVMRPRHTDALELLPAAVKRRR